MTINLAGAGNQVDAGLFATVNLGSSGTLTETISASELSTVEQAISNGIAPSYYQLNATAVGGNNVMVGGLLANFTTTGAGNNRFVIEDPGMLGLPAGTAVSSALSPYGGTFTASGGDNTFAIVGGGSGFNIGNVSLNNASPGTTPSDTLDFSNFQGGGVNLNLGATGTQTVATGLALTLPSASSLANVIGSPGNDTIIGNSSSDTLQGSAVNVTDPYAWPPFRPRIPRPSGFTSISPISRRRRQPMSARWSPSRVRAFRPR